MKIRHAALKRAIPFAGHVTESPPYSNRGPLIDKWNLDAIGIVGVYWCLSFLHGMFKLVGYNLPGGASVPALLASAKKDGWLVSRPRRGDLVCFQFSDHSRFGPFGDHVGIVVRVLALRWNGDTFAGWIRTVEGNTSAQANITSSQSNGGGVFTRTRWITAPIGARFVRVPGNISI